MTDLPDIGVRVKAGSQWLDEHVPGWADRVIVQELDIESRCECVLGQLFTTFDSFGGEAEYGFDRVVPSAALHYRPVANPAPVTLTREEATLLGFDAHHDGEYRTLADFWETEIVARREVQE